MIGSSNAVIKTGGGGGETPSGLSTTGIDFIDYDGTLLAHYDSVPTTLPTAPTVEGLDFREWNWTLAELQEYFTAVPDGYVCVGATRAPSDGKTHIKIKLSDGRLSPKLWFSSSQSNVEASGTIDWGDGTIDEWARSTTRAVAQEHTYQQAGEYEIVLSVEAGEISVSSTSLLFYETSSSSQLASYNAAIKEIYFGDNFLIKAAGTTMRVLQSAGLLEKVTWTPDNLKPYYNGMGRIVSDSPLIKALVMPRGFRAGVFTGAGSACVQLSALSLPKSTAMSMGTGAFGGLYGLASIYIPERMITIGDSAFGNCSSLTSVHIPDRVTTISSNAFYNCYNLTDINIPDSVVRIGGGAFQSCYSLTSIHIPDRVTSIEGSTFYKCHNLTNVNIPDGVTTIGNSAFNGCRSLTSIHIPDGVTSIGSSTFYSCYSLTSVNIPDGVTSIGNSAFSDCFSLTNIHIPNGVTSIDSNAFNNCYSLTSINIPDGITSIEGSTFSGCRSLTSVSIPAGVTIIESTAFYQCYFLKEIHLHSTTPPTLSSVTAFGGTSSDMVIYVPQGTLETYQQATNWTRYASQMQEEA